MEDFQGIRILIIEDDVELLELVKHVLSRQKAEVYTAVNGLEGLRQFYDYRPDLVILDLMLPELSGWEVCRRIRQLSDVPLIMLTARVRNDEIIQGLASGADDYITKPFSAKVLIARSLALLRRTTHPSPNEKPNSYYDGHLRIDLIRRVVKVGGQEVKLSKKEYELLIYLFENAGRVLTFEQILDSVWGWEYQNHVEYVRSYIWRLRQKLEEDPQNPIYVLTEHGIGYRFIKESLD